MTRLATELTRVSTLLTCQEALGPRSGRLALTEMRAVARATGMGGNRLAANEGAQRCATDRTNGCATNPSQRCATEDTPAEPLHNVASAKSSR